MKIRKIEVIFLSIISIVTILFHLYDLGLPPLWPDEATFFLSGLTLTNPINSDLYIFGSQFGWHFGQFPVGYAPYFGALTSYTSFPVHYFMGSTVEMIRTYSSIVAVSIVILLYFVCKELFSSRVGIISSTLLAFFPLFIFWSRQSVAYEWILVSILLMMIIFSMRFFKTGKLQYLYATLFFVGIGIWGYLWFVYPLIVAIILLPLWYKPLKKNLSTKNNLERYFVSKYKFIINWKTVIFGCISFVAGLIPLIAHLAIAKNSSLVPFILMTILQDSFYKPANVVVSNTNFIENFQLRLQHFINILIEPAGGLTIANLNPTWSHPYFIILSLFIISIIFSIYYIIKKKEHFKILIGLLIFFPTILILSSFTVSAFHIMQIGFVIPFIFIIIGKFIEEVVNNVKIKKYLTIYKIQSNHILTLLIISLLISQISLIVEGFNALENSKTSSVNTTYDSLNRYMTEKQLIAVTFDFFTQKGFLFNMHGEHIPIIIHGIGETPDFNEKVKKSMMNAEFFNLIDDKYLFIVNTYPKLIDCDKESTSGGWSNQCAQFYFVESAAERNHKDIEINDFNLSDGTSYLRVLKFVNKN